MKCSGLLSYFGNTGRKLKSVLQKESGEFHQLGRVFRASFPVVNGIIAEVAYMVGPFIKDTADDRLVFQVLNTPLKRFAFASKFLDGAFQNGSASRYDPMRLFLFAEHGLQVQEIGVYGGGQRRVTVKRFGFGPYMQNFRRRAVIQFFLMLDMFAQSMEVIHVGAKFEQDGATA